ncbi:MAG: endopeptidase La, partial [Planctomycetes bacterium]|nr:endopeptidase La [Planctomycetota bacterium]
RDRLAHLEVLLQKEITILELGSRIQSEVQSEIGKNQREHLLREQMKVIQRELGEGDDRAAEAVELRGKVRKAKMTTEAEKVALDEIDRLLRIPVGSSEYTVARTYVDWLVALPWAVLTKDQLDLLKARRILDEDHDGLDKVKERILEYLAVRKLKPDSRGPILCFVGPPGVGKTSLGRSIARAMGRKFVRLSLGGVRDEAEIRGHRRTYVGALPGRVLQSLRKAASRNPIFMLDEIDKLGIDFRGDPASALLEVLDPEQNFAFSDHYLEVAFDLSRVMFITTANLLDPIPPALHDRMEVLELPGYTEEEKLRIARNHLIPKQVEEHGLGARRLSFSDDAIRRIITSYTREAGLRNLEREIGNICRKVARAVAERRSAPTRITPAIVARWLGVAQFESEVADRCASPGVATGLAWTMSGGELLFIEATAMKGGKDLRLTGHLGDVMKESAMAALSYIRANSAAMRLDEDYFHKHDIHIHVPAGAIPKDGPSAGITITVALVSLLLGRPVRPDIALTGEITLRGKVLPVGGIKEKVLAARRGGIRTVLLPARNRKDLKEVPAAVTKGMKFVFIDRIDDALVHVFDRAGRGAKQNTGPARADRAPRPRDQRPTPTRPGAPAPRPEVRP